MQAVLMMMAVVFANVLGAAMTLPQVRQLFVTRQVAGVSAAWAGAGLAGNAWWLAYGIGIGEPAILPVSLISVMAYCAIVVAMVRFHPSAAPIGGVALGLSMALIPLPFAVAWGWAAAGLVLGLLYGVQLAPAVIEVFRSVDLSGVSAATWSMACVEAGLWGAYAIPRRDIGVMALGFIGIVMSAAVLARQLRWRRSISTVEPVGFVGAPA